MTTGILTVKPVYVLEIKGEGNTTNALLNPYFLWMFFFLLVHLWLLWCALSCQRVQADLFSRCMHNLVVMKLAWRREPLKHKRHTCMRCVLRLSWVQLMCHYCAGDGTTKLKKQDTIWWYMVALGTSHSHLLSHFERINPQLWVTMLHLTE